MRGAVLTDRNSRPDWLARLDAFWFAPTPALRLAVVRVLVFGFGVIWMLMMAKTVRDTERLSASHFRPVGVVSWIDSPLDLNFTLALYLLCFAAGIASLLGWKYRVSAPLHGLTLLWITTYRNSWGMVFHSENLWVMHTLILACLPAADAWSLDARRKLANPDPDLRYGWGLRLMATIAALTYVLAGGGQIAHSWRRMVERRCVVWPCRVGQPAKTRARSRTFAARCRAFELARSICTPRLAEHRSRIMRSDRTVRSATRVAVTITTWSFHIGVAALMAIVFPYPVSGIAFVPLFAVEQPVLALAARARARSGLVYRMLARVLPDDVSPERGG